MWVRTYVKEASGSAEPSGHSTYGMPPDGEGGMMIQEVDQPHNRLLNNLLCAMMQHNMLNHFNT
eukprot:2954117-Ditylum_brightwellii.AAC.1